MYKNSIDSEVRAMYPIIDMLEEERGYYEEHADEIMEEEVDPMEFLKGPDSNDFGTVFEWHKMNRRRVSPLVQLVNKCKSLYSRILKK
jgi:hypothetical protein